MMIPVDITQDDIYLYNHHDVDPLKLAFERSFPGSNPQIEVLGITFAYKGVERTHRNSYSLQWLVVDIGDSMPVRPASFYIEVEE